jgi:hypothetical protein
VLEGKATPDKVEDQRRFGLRSLATPAEKTA